MISTISQKFRIHREGYPIVAAVMLGSICVGMALTRYLPAQLARSFVAFLGIINLLVLCFFRNPARTRPSCRSTIIAPASGTIVTIARVNEAEYSQQQCIKIAIFLSVFNVHVNVLPVNGEVVYSKYHPGKYLAAFHPKASELNERSVVALQTPTGHTVLVRQIAGIVARRISTYVRKGDVVCCGDELGFIKFGSRVELFIPLSSKITVHVGDRVKVGVTTLAVLSSNAETELNWSST